VGVADLALELDSTNEAPHEARQTIRARFAERLPAPALYDLLTVVSELVANGVRHGKGETVRVQIAVDGDGRIRGEVESDGSGTVAPRPVDLDRQTGLGLRIVAALVERWRVIADGTTRVRFELRSL
jgi:anti-sigma regulatory factor (Ser/Thr protein kinase)